MGISCFRWSQSLHFRVTTKITTQTTQSQQRELLHFIPMRVVFALQTFQSTFWSWNPAGKCISFLCEKTHDISAKTTIGAKIAWMARGFGGNPMVCSRTSLHLQPRAETQAEPALHSVRADSREYFPIKEKPLGEEHHQPVLERGFLHRFGVPAQLWCRHGLPRGSQRHAGQVRNATGHSLVMGTPANPRACYPISYQYMGHWILFGNFCLRVKN